MIQRGKNIFILCIFTITIIHANLDDDIRAIQSAPASERYKLMNAFKKNLIKMNEKERIKAITMLGKKSNKKNAKKALEELKKEDKRKRLRKEVEQQQIETENIANETEDFNGGDNDNE